MRTAKNTGGLTRGNGTTEAQRNVWLMSMPACAQMNEAMQNVCGVQYTTSEHKEMAIPRQERDKKDIGVAK